MWMARQEGITMFHLTGVRPYCIAKRTRRARDTTPINYSALTKLPCGLSCNRLSKPADFNASA